MLRSNSYFLTQYDALGLYQCGAMLVSVNISAAQTTT